MGGGAYDNDAHQALTTKRATQTKEQVFTKTGLDNDMNPFGVKVRESRDSAAHPNSIGIIFVLDETGSMQDIPDNLARKELPGFMSLIIDGKFVDDPQLLFSGIGDARCREQAAVQVGQFESEAELMDKWLTAIYLEGGGGGNGGESYDLALYFAARHTSMDCFEKRGKKGYLFITGDDNLFPQVSAEDVGQYIGDKLKKDIPSREIVEEASKTFNCFFLIPDRGRAGSCERSWRNVLGDRVICLESPEDTCAASAVLIGLTEGTIADLDAVGPKLESLGKDTAQANRVIRAVEAYATSIGKGGANRPVEGEPADGKRKPGRV